MNKYSVLLMLSFLFVAILPAAANRQLPLDTLRGKHILDELAKRPLQPHDYQISKHDFTKYYAFDETSEEIITHYFKRRKQSAYLLLAPLAVIGLGILVYGILAGILGFSVIVAVLTFSGEALEPVLAAAKVTSILLMALYGLGWAVRLWGIVRLIMPGRKKLLLKLIEYRKSVKVSE
jgi:hypothetical protein